MKDPIKELVMKIQLIKMDKNVVTKLPRKLKKAMGKFFWDAMTPKERKRINKFLCSKFYKSCQTAFVVPADYSKPTINYWQ